jgi:Predicted membrane protein (DUF2339)
MDGIAILFLLIVLGGGGGLFVALIYAVVTSSSRSERVRRLEREQANLRAGLDQTMARVVSLERALGETMQRLASATLAPAAPPPELAPAAPPPELGTAAPPPAPAVESEAPVAPSEPQIAAAEPTVAEPTAAAPAPSPEPPAPATPADPAPAPAAAAAEAPAPLPEDPEVPVVVETAPEIPEAPPYAQAARVASVEPRPAAPGFDWERWIGVRGAAALGACVLVIAGLYFFKYSIDNGLISPALRVVLGVLVGLAGIGASELTLRRSYTVLANWLAGAGVAILYTAFWAAHGVYGLIGSAPAFAMMIVVTLACGLLALRHEAMVIALLGLLGGFVTPVALSTGEDHPFGLFGYLLLLDGALLYLAHRRRWPVLGALSLLGTALYQAAWIGARMGPEQLGLGMGILVVFGGVYAVASPAAAPGESELGKLTRAATVLLPFGFGLYFGLRADLGARIYPLALMLCVISAGAMWMARARQLAWVSPVAAVAGTTTLGAWLLVHDRAAIGWEAALCAALLATVFHAFLELEARRPSPGARAAIGAAAAIAALGALFCVVVSAVAPSSLDPWPWMAGWALLGALVVRQSLFAGYGALRLGLGVLVGFGFTFVHLWHAEDAAFPGAQVYLAGLVAVTGLGLLSAALLARPASSSDAVPGLRRADTDAVAALLPFLTALYFASRRETGPHLVPLALALAALAAGATRAARARSEATWITAGAALAGLGALAVWIGRHPAEAVAWEVSLLVCLFAGVLHAFAELGQQRGEVASQVVEWTAALTPIAAIGVLAVTAAQPACATPWPWLAGWLALGAMALRQVALPGREPLHLALGAMLGLAFPVVQAAHAEDLAFPGATAWTGAALATAGGVAAAAFVHRAERGRARRWASHGAGLLALLLLVGALAGSRAPAPPALFFLATLALTAIALVSAARLGAGGWSFAAVLVAAFTDTGWTFASLHTPAHTAEDLAAAHAALGGQGLAVVLAAAWPLFAGRRLQKSAWAWRAAALAGPLGFAGLAHAWTSAFGGRAIGVLPIALGLVTLAVALRARDVLPEKGALRLTALVWLLGVTLAAVSVAVPLQLENEWVTVGWALEGAALLALWRRLDHAGLKYTALAHFGVVVVRLVANPWLLEYHPRSGVPVLNWLAYTYWIPALALLGAWSLLRDLEVPRRRPWEGGFYNESRPVFAVAAAAGAVFVFFVWINLTIFDAFGSGRDIEIVFERLPARDLTLSLAWAIYALVLLGAGIARRSAALRWTSLMLILITVGKVFLWDLSHLHDLYRVMSLVGLAFSLILIALAYQRFVFGKGEASAK